PFPEEIEKSKLEIESTKKLLLEELYKLCSKDSARAARQWDDDDIKRMIFRIVDYVRKTNSDIKCIYVAKLSEDPDEIRVLEVCPSIKFDISTEETFNEICPFRFSPRPHFGVELPTSVTI